jgi:hypothetical protein
MERSHIKNLISKLNKLKLKYAFTGAFVTSYNGYHGLRRLVCGMIMALRLNQASTSRRRRP